MVAAVPVAFGSHIPVGVQTHLLVVRLQPTCSTTSLQPVAVASHWLSVLHCVCVHLMSIEKSSMLGPEKLLPLESPVSNVKQTRPFLPANLSSARSTSA